MNIKVAAFTVSEKSINISNLKRDDGTVAKSDTEKAKELIKLLFKNVFVKDNVSNISEFQDRSGGTSVDNIIINEEK